MHRVGCSRHSLRKLLGAVALAAIAASPAAADLLHQYTFNANNAADSVGGLDGMVVDNTGIVTYTGGAVNLSANNGALSDQDFSLPTTVGAYVDLPNNVFSNAVKSQAGGLYGQATLETWFTVQDSRPWAELFVFGRSAGGEDISNGGALPSEYVALIPHSDPPGAPDDFRATTKSITAETPIIGQATPLATNQRHHVVLVLDQSDTDGGVNLNGTATLYLNNGAPVRQPIQPFIDTIDDVNNWLGRSQWNDQLFDGLIDEFRIYDHALSAAEVANSFTTGPEAAPVPVLVVNRDTGAITLENASAGNIQVKGYSITSDAGSLNPAQWQSIDAGNAFDSNGTWTSSSLTSLEIAEANTSGTLDGGTLAPSASRGIGEPWFKTPFEDLAFTFTLGDNSTGMGQVQYVGAEPVRSDLNEDGAVTEADWAIFVPNSYTSLAGQPAAQAYLKGDLDGDLDNDFADFRIFKTDFIAANGEAAFAELVGAVPEPATLSLAGLAAGLLLGTRRRRRRALASATGSSRVNESPTTSQEITPMKRLLVSCIALAAMSASAPATAETVAYWRFEDGTMGADVTHLAGDDAGNTFSPDILDVSGNGNHLSTWITGGCCGYAYRDDVPDAVVPQTGQANTLSVKNTGGAPGMFTDSTVSMPTGIDLETMTPTAFTVEVSYKPQTGGHRTVVGRDAQNVVEGNGALAALYMQARPNNSVGIGFTDLAGNFHEAYSPADLIEGFVFDDDPEGDTGNWYNLVGVSDGSTLKMYVNNELVASTPIVSDNPGLAIGTTSGGDWHAGGWTVGRGLFGGGHGDRAVGFIDEVRISNSALTPSDFLVIPDLTIEVNTTTGDITLANAAAEPISLDFYRIASPEGALSLGDWNSLDGQNYDAVDGDDVGSEAGNTPGEGWDQAGGADTGELVEQFLGEGGSSIAAGASIPLGNAFNTSIFGAGFEGDLEFTYGLNNGAEISSAVTYVGGGGESPGDFDSDGDVDGRDFLALQRGEAPGGFTAANLQAFRNNFGEGAAVAAAAAVPEPSSLVLLVGGALAARRRTKV